MELYTRVDEILHYVWDPIGVSLCPNTRDEYYSYLPQVFSMVKNDAPENDIVNYLNNITTSRMGLNENKKHDLKVAGLLLDWRKFLEDKYSN